MNNEDRNDKVGILCKQDIIDEIDHGRLIINADKNCVEASSYDMRIGTIFRDGQVVNESHSKAHEQFVVQPGEILSIFTLEEVDLPSNIAATAFAMNAQSSRGLLVLNPGHIDPGFRGPLTVKAWNLRKVPLAIGRGTPIFTVVFERLPKHTTSPYNRNLPRYERERQFNEKDVESASNGLSELITISEDAPFPTRHEVKEIVRTNWPRQDVKEEIRKHWLSWLTMGFTFLAALAAIVAAVASVVSITSAHQAINKASPGIDQSSDQSKLQAKKTK